MRCDRLAAATGLEEDHADRSGNDSPRADDDACAVIEHGVVERQERARGTVSATAEQGLDAARLGAHELRDGREAYAIIRPGARELRRVASVDEDQRARRAKTQPGNERAPFGVDADSAWHFEHAASDWGHAREAPSLVLGCRQAESLETLPAQPTALAEPTRRAVAPHQRLVRRPEAAHVRPRLAHDTACLAGSRSSQV